MKPINMSVIPRKKSALIDSELLMPAIYASIRKLNPKEQIQNFVMFVVYLGAIVTTAIFIWDGQMGHWNFFNLQMTLWLWFTVLFANFAESLAEGRGKAHAETLKKARTDTLARVLKKYPKAADETKVSSSSLKPGDIVVCETGDLIPGDGEVIEGIASVDESAITGESAPVIRESGGDRSAVTGGTKVISDRIVIRITSQPGDTFLDRMIALIEGAKRQKTPNEIALSILLIALTILFLIAVGTLRPLAIYSENASGVPIGSTTTITILIGLLVCLIPTTIGGLLSAIGISGIDRLLRANVLATSGRAVEAAGDVDVLLLDKTGTITLGNRMATNFLPAPGVTVEELADLAQLASLSDETPEGRSIVVLAKEKFKIRGRNIADLKAQFIQFSAKTRMSGVNLSTDSGTREIRKGAADAIETFTKQKLNPEVKASVETIARQGGTPLVVCDGIRVLGVIQLKDIVKGGIKERFSELRKMGIKTVMITGDNPLTAAAIAAEAGVDDFIAEATPEAKLKRIRDEQKNGHLIAMIGDGTNDAPALAQADVGIAMNTGTQAAREAGNMVDLDSNPTKLIEVVEIGKKILMTRGALTTFSIANDVAKYFAIIPAMFAALYAFGGHSGPLSSLNIMNLHSPESAILSSVIFNALIIVVLIPLALRGVAYKAMEASALLGKNIVIYGLGGIIAPFVGIKLVDLIIVSLGVVS